MNLLNAGILGIVEGITEFLPISSTAHMILVAKVLGLMQTDFLKSFEIIIQLGAILAVVTLYFNKFLDWQMIKKIIAGFIPTGILGLIFYKIVKDYLGDVSIVLWSLLIGGIVMIWFEIWHKKRLALISTMPDAALANTKISRSTMTMGDCIKVGFFQSIALIPGVSRSAATILGGMSIGISRSVIAEYSFLLAVPTMLAATGLDAIENRDIILHSGNFAYLAVGFITAYVVALFAIKLFLSYIKKHDFVPFGVYRILLALLGFMFLV